MYLCVHELCGARNAGHDGREEKKTVGERIGELYRNILKWLEFTTQRMVRIAHMKKPRASWDGWSYIIRTLFDQQRKQNWTENSGIRAAAATVTAADKKIALVRLLSILQFMYTKKLAMATPKLSLIYVSYTCCRIDICVLSLLSENVHYKWKKKICIEKQWKERQPLFDMSAADGWIFSLFKNSSQLICTIVGIVWNRKQISIHFLMMPTIERC